MVTSRNLNCGSARGTGPTHSDAPIVILFWGNKLWFLFLPFIPLFGRVSGYAPGSILDLYVLLNLREDALHLGDFMLHQVFVEGLRDF